MLHNSLVTRIRRREGYSLAAQGCQHLIDVREEADGQLHIERVLVGVTLARQVGNAAVQPMDDGPKQAHHLCNTT